MAREVILSIDKQVFPSAREPRTELKFKTLEPSKHLLRKREAASLRHSPLNEPYSPPVSTKDNSPVVKDPLTGRVDTVYGTLLYTASRFRTDDDHFRKKASSRYSVDEMVESPFWKKARNRIRNGYRYLSTGGNLWFDAPPESPESPGTSPLSLRQSRRMSLKDFMSEIMGVRDHIMRRLVRYNSLCLRDGVFTSDEERVERIVEKAKDNLNGHLLMIANPVALQASYLSRRIFTEGREPNDMHKLHFTARWRFFDIRENSEGRIIVTLGSNRRKYAEIETALDTQDSLPPVAELLMSTGMWIEWSERNPHAVKLDFYIAKTKVFIPLDKKTRV